MKKIILILVTSTFFAGCLSIAKLSNFSQTSSTIDFYKLAKEYKLAETPFRTTKTTNEYFFEKEIIIEESKLFEIAKNALDACKYSISVSNIENKCIIGKRGLMANEWKSITAIYYKIESNKIQVYVLTKITQDITGGFGENRAMQVGKLIEQKLNSTKN